MDQAHRFYPLSSLELRAMGNRTTEWDLNKWKWDADLFVASPLESVPYNIGGSGQYIPIPVPGGGNSSNSSSSCSDEANPGNETGIWDSERKRRVVVVEDDSGGLGDETGTLTLKLGRHPVSEREFGNVEETNHGKKVKLSGGSANRAVCQVEDCGADLSRAKDYHRRHKVCEMHSKASNALVGNVMQRFCQQCSRFHLLQEFDEGKRSCRRRLAGHNKRRRKTQPETVASGQSVNDEQASNYILISLLRILSGMHANNRGDQATDGQLLHHLLRSLAGQCGQSNISGMLQESQKLLSSAMAYGNSDKMSTFNSNGSHRPPRPNDQHVTLPASGVVQKGLQIANPTDREFQAASMQKPEFMLAKESPPSSSEVRYSSAGREKLNNFDLNDVYVDSDDGMEDPERSPPTVTFGPSSWVQQDSQQSSPPQISGNSDSASAQSPSSSSGEAQSRTDRIVFKLFGKEPNDFPSVLRGQILDWLAHSPTDIESYIRPGCIILTIYLRLAESVWEELCSDLTASLARLLNIADDPFWRTGWVCARVQDQVAFVHNGEVVVQTALRHQDDDCSRIIYVTPIAVSMAEQARFQIKGPNLSRPSTRLLCAIDGDYLVQDSDHESITDKDGSKENDEIECINLSFSIPTVSGRGFIEVEDNGLNSSFFPFIVAEKDVCSEIRMLETSLESAKTDGDAPRGNINKEAVLQVMDFIHEMGWLLHRSNLNNRLGNLNPNTELFSFKRFKWVMEFAMDRDWCAVVKKLLDILLGGTVGSGEHPSLKAALSEIGLLHRAVRRSSRPMVELLLKYVPAGASDDICSQHMSASDEGPVDFLFRPDARGPAGLTPLHIAAGRDGAEDLLDALTSDPRKVGIEAWKNARDSTGFTPEDYARLRGHYSYIHLVQKKLNRRPGAGSSVVLDIPEGLPDGTENPKQNDVVSFEIGKSGGLRSMASKQCGLCHHRLAHGNAVSGQRSLLYRPAMLSMVAIAAVCVCVALLFKSLPQVVYVFQPFRWELLEYGSS